MSIGEVKMFFDIEDNDLLVGKMKSIVTSGNIHHGYIIEGPLNVDKISVAKMFFKAIIRTELKDRRKKEEIESICRRIEDESYVDLTVVEATSAAKTTVKSVKDEDIQFLQDRLGSKAFEGLRNFALIKNADLVTPRAFNRLLKTMEEPPIGTVILLLSENAMNIPETVRSRCVKLRIEEGFASRPAVGTGDATKLKDGISKGMAYYRMKPVIEKIGKDREKILSILESLETMYRDDLVELACSTKRDRIYEIIDEIEAGKRNILSNGNPAYTLKRMIILIGG